jgi:hypothetical protein
LRRRDRAEIRAILRALLALGRLVTHDCGSSVGTGDAGV